ncbi:thiamine-phosphate kinase [Mycolicibacterium peregrinum]|uniref:Thiamine-monophosphate kinase n=1 Tax=Mycolicibacterium peregrinum TaxID=43304 RepID=A0A246BR59_MYCPR|nr:thiamine-phosphate kinase [Mycolicibacterium peregrinum]OWL98153.1 thiamine-phosphate kinase [Mycolicibacterium peregrinum]TGB43242.1 thiamine-phosphate kinase [Mycolicibacterium peregrinum]TGB43987.1 thiamine-phosphate kinase [Mycolicibacterium peregrinum]
MTGETIGDDPGDDDGDTLAGAGEFVVIDRLVAGRAQADTVTLGPGDDAAVVTAPDGRTAVSTDMLVQDRHFRLDWSTPHDIGRKAIAQNAADIEAMGGRATAFVVAFGAPPDTPVTAAKEVSDGLWDEARVLGASIAGGDLVSAPLWVISVTVLGDLGGREPVRRSGARVGDTVAVAGDLGRSAAGFALWERGIEGQDGFAELRQRHLTPHPPYGQGARAADAGATAMTDVSDGLLADLGHIATASGVGIDLDSGLLDADRLAVTDAATAVSADPWEWVLGGGEDHALAATFPGALPPGWRAVGRVLEGPARVLVDGAPWAGNAGWQSFD